MAALPRSSLRTSMITRAPSAASVRAVSRPMPELAPVTTTFLPCMCAAAAVTAVTMTRSYHEEHLIRMQQSVTWLGHATALVQLGGARFVTDPNLSRTVGVVLPRRGRPPMAAEALAPLDGVLISHAHLDHCDLPTLKKIRRA